MSEPPCPSVGSDNPASAYPVGSIRGGWDGRAVPRPDFPRSIIEFQDRFATEEACRQYNPAQARWTQPDPLSQLGNLTQGNRYT